MTDDQSFPQRHGSGKKPVVTGRRKNNWSEITAAEFWYLTLKIVVLVVAILAGLNTLLDIHRIPAWVTYVGSIATLLIACLLWVTRKQRLLSLNLPGPRVVYAALAIVFLAVWWPRALDWYFSPPKVFVSLTSANPSGFVPDTEIEGVKWKPGFHLYTLKVRNLSEDVDITKLRLDLRIPGAVIHYKLKSSEGTETVNLFQRGFELCGPLTQRGLLSSVSKIYVNDLQINTNELYAGGNFEIRMILFVEPTWPQPGMIETNYSYLDRGGSKSLGLLRHRLFVKDKSSNRLLVKESVEQPPSMYAAVFAEPFRFQNGMEIAAIFLSTNPNMAGALAPIN